MLITFSTLSVSGQAKGNKSVHKSDRVINKHAHVVELVDTLDLGSSAERRAGSSPVMGTKA